MSDAIRPTLGGFMSLTCFHYLRHGAEDTAGRALIVSADRQRGFDVVTALGLAGNLRDAEIIREHLAQILGIQGTHLCLVKSISAKPNGGYEVHITEGACTAGVTDATEPYCAFTMGVFIGAISAFTGQRMNGKETECSAMGKPECVYQIDPIS
jgi:predicted hydrocarbon binding protein